MHLYLVHHGEAAGAETDARRPLTPQGQEAVTRLAAQAAARGAKPDIVWHSGKLRARQTAEAFWKACNALAEFSATRDLQPDDPPGWMFDRLRGEPKDVLIAGHFPYLPRLASLLRGDEEGGAATFPVHGVVAFVTENDGVTWREEWVLEAGE